MELANFYLKDKTLIHKLFKVLVPRYMNYTTSFTSMYLLSNRDIDWSNYRQRSYVNQRVLIELKGNPYPPLLNHDLKRNNLLHNILLSQVSRDYYMNRTNVDSEISKEQD
ncbi:39S ribosomal protein L17, mitochondrial-like protein [Euroglyphus maynei]|uniref:39S ribosomal protein L17, mitochondrial-like protein n=1 Tax=Euroglyphus maynei TaxID=6958 RepID=A0A1Y3BS12_EURMA|nr:39S ribosomal protein L17, mitochondrial-like protein [Euroglyphus maynei]